MKEICRAGIEDLTQSGTDFVADYRSLASLSDLRANIDASARESRLNPERLGGWSPQGIGALVNSAANIIAACEPL